MKVLLKHSMRRMIGEMRAWTDVVTKLDANVRAVNKTADTPPTITGATVQGHSGDWWCRIDLPGLVAIPTNFVLEKRYSGSATYVSAIS